MSDKPAPFDFLRAIDARARRTGKVTAGGEAKGVVVRLGAFEVLAAMSEIVEIIPPPPLARIPGAKSWVLGVGNLHGDLVPAFDLAALILGLATRRDERGNRLLVVGRRGARAGLLVEAVLGQKILAGQPAPTPPPVVDALAPWIISGWTLEDRTWPLLGLGRLVDSALFHDVAA